MQHSMEKTQTGQSSVQKTRPFLANKVSEAHEDDSEALPKLTEVFFPEYLLINTPLYKKNTTSEPLNSVYIWC